MKNLTLLLLLAALCGCNDQPEDQFIVEYVPTSDSERQAVQKMVVDICAATYSPATHSPEDIIRQAELTAMHTLCRPTRWKWNTTTGKYYPAEPQAWK